MNNPSSADIDALSALIAPAVASAGFALVRICLNESQDDEDDSPTVQVMAEDPQTGQLTLDQCVRISRALSEILDARDPLDMPYRLEVSSPGIDRPLTRPHDWATWIGHDVAIQCTQPIKGHQTFNGTILSVHEDGQGATVRASDIGDISVTFDDIAHAQLILTERLIAQTPSLAVS